MAVLPTREARLLCRMGDLVEGRSHGFDPLGEGRDTMFIVRRLGRLFAYRNACPHYEMARMAWKKNEFLNGDGSQILCAAHGALFDIASGVCTIGPCIGQHLTPVQVEIRDDQVWQIGPYAPGRRARHSGAAPLSAPQPIPGDAHAAPHR